MIPSLSLGLLLSLFGPARAQDRETSEAPDDEPTLELAREMARDGRADEAVSLLLQLLDDPEQRAEAAPRLRTLLLTAPPRRAWADAYVAALQDAPAEQRHALQVRAAQADLQDPATQANAIRRLQRLLDEDRGNIELRVSLGEALLEAGRFQEALRIYGDLRTEAARKGRVAGLVAVDRIDDAERLDPEQVPVSCRTARTPTACAVGLREMGYPGAAAASLRAALQGNHRELRSRSSQAGAWSTIATIEESRGELSAATEAWQQAVRLDPDNQIYRDRLAQLLAATGRTAEAARVAGSADAGLSQSLEAVRLATSVNPGQPGERVDRAIQEAHRLDPNHPVVARAYAHWLVSRGRPEEALRVLTPHIEAHLTEPGWLDIYVWAATASGQPEAAADLVQDAMARVDDPRRWQNRLALQSSLQASAAEQAKARKDYDEAESRYRLARAADPTSIRALTGLAGVLWERGKVEEAAETYREALVKAPGNRVALFSLVEILRQQGREAEARQLLLESGYDDLRVRQLEAELAVMDQAADARRLREAGRLDEAIVAYARLVETHGEVAPLLHAYADALAEDGRLIEAAEIYARARAADPESPNLPWVALGEINALIALGEVEEARRLLSQLPEDPDSEDLARAITRARYGVDRIEAERLLAEGNEAAAVALIQRWSSGADDPASAVAIGDLYLSRWQYSTAAAWYDTALSLDPDNQDAIRGLIRARLGQGRLRQAEERVSRLVQQHPTTENTALARTVSQRIALERAVAAAASGNHEMAERILLDQLELYPGDLDLRVAHARLLLLRGEEEAAFREAEGVLRKDPQHPEALSALQTAALRLGRSEQALGYYEAALAAGGEPWVEDEIEVLRLAARLDKARSLAATGPREAAYQVVEQAALYYGDGDARRWTLIGSAWLDLGRPQEAIEAFELARRQDPADPGAAIGLAGAWESLGQPARAEGVLSQHWEEHRHPEVAVALVGLQRRRDRRDAARRTLRELEDVAGEGGVVVYAESAPPRALPVVTPAGMSPEDDPARRPLDAPAWAAVDVGRLDDEEGSEWPFSATAGGGWAARPGDSGQQFLNLLYLPIAAELDLPGPIAIQGEAIPVQMSDGVTEVTGNSLSLGLTTGLPGGWGAQARIGRDAVGVPGAPAYGTWFVAAEGRLGAGVVAGVETGRAPVTDSLTSWAGAYTAAGLPYGRARDTWVGGTLSRGWATGSNLGILGRAGHASGEGGMGDVPWLQGLAWGRTPLEPQGNRRTWLGFEALVLDHERQVDGFGPGQGGMFTPDLFLSGIARLEMAWVPDAGRLSACGMAGAGPQVVEGDQTLYLYPGTYVGYQLQGTLRADLGKDWLLAGNGFHTGTFGAWGQTGLLVQLRYGRDDGGLRAPSPVFSSLVHGMPLAEPQICAAGWWEVTP